VQQYTGAGRLDPAVFNTDGSPAGDSKPRAGGRRALVDASAPAIRFGAPKCAACDTKSKN
jgi:hypothetical protein